MTNPSFTKIYKYLNQDWISIKICHNFHYIIVYIKIDYKFKSMYFGNIRAYFLLLLFPYSMINLSTKLGTFS